MMFITITSEFLTTTLDSNISDLTVTSDGIRVPDPGLKPGFFPFKRVGFFSLKTRVPGFPIFPIFFNNLRLKNPRKMHEKHDV